MFILKLSYSEPFHDTLNYASTANIEEVMKFRNLGDKTFETEFSFIGYISRNAILMKFCYLTRHTLIHTTSLRYYEK